MPELIQNAQTAGTLALPFIGLVTLMMSKLPTGAAARGAERRFIATLILVTVLAARTVIASDDAWLLHMMTLALMIVGSLSIPDHKAAVSTSEAAI